MKKQQIVAVALTACLGLSLLSGCKSGKSGSSDAKKTVLNIATVTADMSLDPIHASDALSINLLGNIIGGLYSVDPKDKLKPELAKSVSVSPDGKTYTFTLRDQKWSDGSDLTADDFVFAWRRLADPNSGTEYAYLIEEANIKNGEAVTEGKMKPEQLGVTAKDSHTLVVELERPCTYFESMLAFSPFSPLKESFVKAQGSKFAMSPQNMLYCGPYQLTTWDTAGNTYTISKNDGYWDASDTQVGQINFKVVSDTQQGVMSYENGDLDRITLTGDLVSKYKNSDEYSSALGNFNWYLYFNDKKISNVKLRQAIAYSVDRDQLVNKVLKNGSMAQDNILMTGLYLNSAGEDFNKACGSHYATDAAKAKELWAEAQKETDIRSISLTYETDSDFVANVAAYVQSSIENALPGLKVSLQALPKKNRIANMKSGNYDVALHRWGPDYPDASCIMSLYTTGSTYNYAKWSNADYDKLVNQASTTDSNNASARWNDYVKAESILMDSAVNIPLFQTADAVLTRKTVHNVTSHLTGVSCYYKYVTVG